MLLLLFSLQYDSERRPELNQTLRPLKIECKVQEYLWLSLQTAVLDAAKLIRPDPQQSSSDNNISYSYVDFVRNVSPDSNRAEVQKMSYERFSILCQHLWEKALETVKTMQRQSNGSTEDIWHFKCSEAETAFKAHRDLMLKLFDSRKVGTMIASLFPPFVKNGAYDVASAHCQAAVHQLGQMLALSHKFYRDSDYLNQRYVDHVFDNIVVTGGSRAQCPNTIYSYLLNIDKWEPMLARAYHPEDTHQKVFRFNLGNLLKQALKHSEAGRAEEFLACIGEATELLANPSCNLQDYIFGHIKNKDNECEQAIHHMQRCEIRCCPQKESVPDTRVKNQFMGEGSNIPHQTRMTTPQVTAEIVAPKTEGLMQTIVAAAQDCHTLNQVCVMTMNNEEIGVHVLHCYPWPIHRVTGESVTAEEYRKMREVYDFSLGEAWEYDLYLKHVGQGRSCRWGDYEFVMKIDVETVYMPKYSLHTVPSPSSRPEGEFKNLEMFNNITQHCPQKRVNTVFRNRVRCGFGAGPRPKPWRPWTPDVRTHNKITADGKEHLGPIVQPKAKGEEMAPPEEMYTGSYQQHLKRSDEKRFPALKRTPKADGRLLRYLWSVLSAVDYTAGALHRIHSRRLLRNEEIANRYDQSVSSHREINLPKKSLPEDNWTPIPHDLACADIKSQAVEEPRSVPGVKREWKVDKADFEFSATRDWCRRANKRRENCRDRDPTEVPTCFSTNRDPFTHTAKRKPLKEHMDDVLKKHRSTSQSKLQEPDLSERAWKASVEQSQRKEFDTIEFHVEELSIFDPEEDDAARPSTSTAPSQSTVDLSDCSPTVARTGYEDYARDNEAYKALETNLSSWKNFVPIRKKGESDEDLKKRAIMIMTFDYDLASDWVDLKRRGVSVFEPETRPEVLDTYRQLYDRTIVKDKKDEPDGMMWPSKLIGMTKQANSEREELTSDGTPRWYFIPEGEFRSGRENAKIAITLLEEDDSENEDTEGVKTQELEVMAIRKKHYLPQHGCSEYQKKGTVGRCFQTSSTLVSRGTPVPAITREEDDFAKSIADEVFVDTEGDIEAYNAAYDNSIEERRVDLNPWARVFFDKETATDMVKQRKIGVDTKSDKNKDPAKSSSIYSDKVSRLIQEAGLESAEPSDSPNSSASDVHESDNSLQLKHLLAENEKAVVSSLRKKLEEITVKERQSIEKLYGGTTGKAHDKQAAKKILYFELTTQLREVMIANGEEKAQAWKNASDVLLELQSERCCKGESSAGSMSTSRQSSPVPPRGRSISKDNTPSVSRDPSPASSTSSRSSGQKRQYEPSSSAETPPSKRPTQIQAREETAAQPGGSQTWGPKDPKGFWKTSTVAQNMAVVVDKSIHEKPVLFDQPSVSTKSDFARQNIVTVVLGNTPDVGQSQMLFHALQSVDTQSLSTILQKLMLWRVLVTPELEKLELLQKKFQEAVAAALVKEKFTVDPQNLPKAAEKMVAVPPHLKDTLQGWMLRKRIRDFNSDCGPEHGDSWASFLREAISKGGPLQKDKGKTDHLAEEMMNNMKQLCDYLSSRDWKIWMFDENIRREMLERVAYLYYYVGESVVGETRCLHLQVLMGLLTWEEMVCAERKLMSNQQQQHQEQLPSYLKVGGTSLDLSKFVEMWT